MRRQHVQPYLPGVGPKAGFASLITKEIESGASTGGRTNVGVIAVNAMPEGEREIGLDILHGRTRNKAVEGVSH